MSYPEVIINKKYTKSIEKKPHLRFKYQPRVGSCCSPSSGSRAKARTAAAISPGPGWLAQWKRGHMAMLSRQEVTQFGRGCTEETLWWGVAHGANP